MGTLLNINVPAGEPDGVEVARLGKRIYRDSLDVVEEEDGQRGASGSTATRPSTTTSRAPTWPPSPPGRVSVTPLHFDLTAEHGLEALRAYDLAALLQPAAEEVAE